MAAAVLLDRLDLRAVAPCDLPAALPCPSWDADLPTAAVAEILADVAARGDAALLELTERFDGVRLASVLVPPSEISAALDAVPRELRSALTVARDRVRAYHEHQRSSDSEVVVGEVVVHHLVRPVRRAGVYAPGGRAQYPSSVVMGAVPAAVAGVEEIVLCVPPRADGSVAPETLAAAALCGIEEVVRVGGAQGIGALAFGTESVQPVQVIVGPGNRYVAEAKRQVAGRVGIPSAFAGPSEVVVVADESVPAAWAAVDVLVQAEHGPDGLAWLVTWDEAVAAAIEAEVDRQVAASPRAADLRATLGRSGYSVLVAGPEAAVAVANEVAPEHLELLVADPRRLLPAVRSAGAVFLGPLAPASLGDYVAGPNHVLPTARTARFSSALRVDDFCTHIHAVEVDQAGLAALAPHVAVLAAAEGLPAHEASVTLRQAAVADGSATPSRR